MVQSPTRPMVPALLNTRSRTKTLHVIALRKQEVVYATPKQSKQMSKMSQIIDRNEEYWQALVSQMGFDLFMV